MNYGDEPRDLVSKLRRELQRTAAGSGQAGDNLPRPFSPPLDIIRTAEGLVVTLEVPGLTRDELSVELEGDVLTVTGERLTGAGSGEGQWLRRERRSGRFVRSLALPPGSGRAVEAVLRDGVLTLKLTAETSQIRVPVSGEA